MITFCHEGMAAEFVYDQECAGVMRPQRSTFSDPQQNIRPSPLRQLSFILIIL